MGANEGVHRLAGHFDQARAFEALAILHCRQPGVGLLAGHLKDVLLHLDEAVEAPLCQFGGGNGRRVTGNALLHACGYDLVLLLHQTEEQFLALDEVRHGFACQFAGYRNRTKIGVSEAASHQVYGIGVLGHGQIDQDSLGGKEILYSLLHPSGQQRNKR